MVVILRGASGAGKSVLADLLLASNATEFDFGTNIVGPAIDYCKSLWHSIQKSGDAKHRITADDYFMVNGEYKFDPKFLGAAHNSCLRHYNEIVGREGNTIVVDNTNTSLSEFVPYAAFASAYAHEIHIITLVVSPLKAFSRTRHKTPFSQIVKQVYNLEKSIIEMPPWFPQQIFPAE